MLLSDFLIVVIFVAAALGDFIIGTLSERQRWATWRQLLA